MRPVTCSARLRRRGVGIEQTMQMHDEISHLGVVDGLLRLRFPGAVGRRVIWKHADHVDFRQVLEFDAVDIA